MGWEVVAGGLAVGAAGWLYWRTRQMVEEARSAMVCLAETVWALQAYLQTRADEESETDLDALLDELIAELGPDGLMALLADVMAARAADEDYDALLRAAEERHDPCND